MDRKIAINSGMKGRNKEAIKEGVNERGKAGRKRKKEKEEGHVDDWTRRDEEVQTDRRL